MKYDDFISVFNKRIFEGAIRGLFSSMAKNPERFVGIFRSTPPKAKIVQNISQSQEIKFGDALEELIGLYLEENGFSLLPKVLHKSDGSELHLDQHFTKNKQFYFSEQKVRDDHDSTKKTGQFKNFKDKLEFLEKKYSPESLSGFFYFIDPSFKKNINYYQTEIKFLQSKKSSTLKLQYGSEFFDNLGIPHVWTEICTYLLEWRNTVPEVPELDLDADPHETLKNLLECKPKELELIFSNDNLYNEIIEYLFPTKETLVLLRDYAAKHSAANPYFGTVNAILRKRLKHE